MTETQNSFFRPFSEIFEKSPYSQDDVLTLTDIIARGWTRTTIDKILGQHDREKESNYGGKKCAKIKLFYWNRIKEAEQSPEFLEWSKKRAEKKKPLTAKQQRFEDFMNNIVIDIPIMSVDDLKQLTVNRYRAKKKQAEDEDRFMPSWTAATVDDYTIRTLQLMSKTHLTEFKEDITNYLDLDNTVRNHKMFKIKLYSEIAKAYPHLKEKCDECSEKHLPASPDQ